MKISDVTYSKAASSLRKRKEVSGSESFENYLGETESTNATSGTAPMSGVDALLSVQEVGDALSSPARQAVQDGLDTLDILESLRIALLQGALPEHQLINIRDQIEKQKANIDDPQLAAILQDIELRAAVELAKLEKAATQTY